MKTINTVEGRKGEVYKAKKKNYGKVKTQNKKAVPIYHKKYKGITFI